MSPIRRILAALACALLVVATGPHRLADRSGAADLAPVLFPESSGWVSNQGAKSDLTVALVDGEPVFRVGPTGLTLSSKLKVASETELRLRFRITSPENKGSYFTVRPGLAKPDSPATNPLHLYLTVPAGADPESL